MLRVQVHRYFDEKRSARAWFAIALGMLKDPQAVPLLISQLDAKDSRVAEAAAMALGEIRDARAIAPLIEHLHRDGRLSLAAVWALGELRDKRAVAPILAAWKKQRPSERQLEYHLHYCESALESITGQKLGGDPEKWEQWGRQNDGRAAEPR